MADIHSYMTYIYIFEKTIINREKLTNLPKMCEDVEHAVIRVINLHWSVAYRKKRCKLFKFTGLRKEYC